jgi:hypothetical protein
MSELIEREEDAFKLNPELSQWRTCVLTPLDVARASCA